jgi:hypothetical protein
MIFLGYILGILIGICLGMLGAGGAVLTIPVLVYIMHVEPFLATTYSLFIVGTTAFIGATDYVRKKQYNAKAILFFGIPSIISVFITARYLVPLTPENLFYVGHYPVTKNVGLMIVFAFFMFVSSFAMMRSYRRIKQEEIQQAGRYRYGLILLQGVLVGFIIAPLCAGGGFLIIPALVLLCKLPMKQAVGSSLILITLNSAVGFLGKLSPDIYIDWNFLLTFSSFTITGILTGIYLLRYITGQRLRYIFAWFILLIGVVVLTQEIINFNHITTKP